MSINLLDEFIYHMHFMHMNPLLSHLRKTGRTQADLGDAIGVAQSTISRATRDDARTVTIDLALQIERETGVPALDLLASALEARRAQMASAAQNGTEAAA